MVNETKCAECGKKCNKKETEYKIKHKDDVHFFCSKECKNRFQKKHFGEVIY